MGQNSRNFLIYEFRILSLLCEIWHRLYLHYVQIAQDTPHPQKHLQRLKDILSYLQEHASEELSLEDIAAHAGLCKSECCRFFQKIYADDHLRLPAVYTDSEQYSTSYGRGEYYYDCRTCRIFLTGILWPDF